VFFFVNILNGAIFRLRIFSGCFPPKKFIYLCDFKARLMPLLLRRSSFHHPFWMPTPLGKWSSRPFLETSVSLAFFFTDIRQWPMPLE
jgi:hypothetical protein